MAEHMASSPFVELDTLVALAASVEEGGWYYSADLIRKAVAELQASRKVVEAARISAELAPRVPDGNKFGNPFTVPNPVIGALKDLDARD